MNRFRRLAFRSVSTLAVVLTALVAGCATQITGSEEFQGVPKQLRDRQIIVTLEDVTREQLAATAQSIASDYHLWQRGSFPLDSIRVQCIVYEVQGDRDMDEILARLRWDTRIESVQVNAVFSGIQGENGDPYSKIEYGAKAVGADRAHRVSTGKGVRIAIIDTGMNQNHPDLLGRVTRIANFVDGGETSFARDTHGTAVAGVIGARANDGIGIYGVAPEAELVAAKACWYASSGSRTALCSSWTLARAIDFAIATKSRIINMSLSGPADVLLERLIRVAQDKGAIVVAAAAQNSASPGFPANISSVLAVIASDVNSRVHQPTWTLDRFVSAAPGIDILTSVPKEGYDFLSGSSFAAAHVSGIIALLLEQRPNISLLEIFNLLASTARSVDGAATNMKIGIVDACAALKKLGAELGC